MGHEDFLRNLWITKTIVRIMWTFVLFSIWNKFIDVKSKFSFKFMTCNNMFDFLWTFMIVFQCGMDVLMDNITTCIMELKS